MGGPHPIGSPPMAPMQAPGAPGMPLLHAAGTGPSSPVSNGAPPASAPPRTSGSAGRLHASLLAHLPLAEALAGPELCATLRPQAPKPRASGPADALRAEAKPWELEHMRALFPAAEMTRRVAAARTRLGLAAEVDPALLAASTKLLAEVASH